MVIMMVAKMTWATRPTVKEMMVAVRPTMNSDGSS